MSAAITVVIPVHADAAFLPQALGSLQAQTFADWQAILCPTDATAQQRALALVRGDPRMHVQPVLASAALAQHAATSHCTSDLLCVLDGNDVLDANALAALHALLLQHPDAGMAYSRHVLIDAQGRALGAGPLCELPYSPEALLLDCMTGPLRLLRSTAYRAAGGYRDDFPDAADYDLCLRLSESCAIVHLAQALYQRRIHPHAPEVLRWGEQIEDRYRAFVAAVHRRGLDVRYDCTLQIDSWHVLQANRPFGGIRGLP